jgi:uncharacterized repeat protein (TIGR03803 family)
MAPGNVYDHGTRLRSWDKQISYGGGLAVTKLSGSKMGFVLLLLCLVMAITAPAQTFTSLFKFNGSDGANPIFTSLVQGADGSLYGSTVQGGTGSCLNSIGCGTIFKVTPRGISTIFNFTCPQADCDELAFPVGTLAFDSDGVFYGVANGAGSFFCGQSNGCGGIFKVTATGKFTSLFTFTEFSQGYLPLGITLASDGNFYGIAELGGIECDGSLGCGTAFKLTPAGAFSVVADFSGLDAFPVGQLTLGSDGKLYGATAGYPVSNGSVFKMTRSGEIRDRPIGSSSGAAIPGAGLVQGVDGNFYGTTEFDSSDLNGGGTVFKVTPQGDSSILHSFCQVNCSDGRDPDGALLQATDGNLYGMTRYGGDLNCNPPNGCGAIFQISPDGAFVTLHTFDGTDGESPLNGLVQRTDGVLYGVTFGGGKPGKMCSLGCGTVFSLDMGLGPFVTFIRNWGRVGQTGGILGQGFKGTTSVALNGVPATFTVVADTFIRATVPPGATSGYVPVTTPSGTLTSNKPFLVLP